MGPGRIDSGGGGDGRYKRYFGALPSARVHIVKGKEDVGDGAARERGEVLDGIYSRVRSQDFLGGGHLGPGAQLRPLNGHGVPVRHLPKGELALPQAKDAPLAPTARISDKDMGGQDLRQVAARRDEARQTGSAPKLVDFGGNVENH